MPLLAPVLLDFALGTAWPWPGTALLRLPMFVLALGTAWPWPGPAFLGFPTFVFPFRTTRSGAAFPFPLFKGHPLQHAGEKNTGDFHTSSIALNISILFRNNKDINGFCEMFIVGSTVFILMFGTPEKKLCWCKNIRGNFENIKKSLNHTFILVIHLQTERMWTVYNT